MQPNIEMSLKKKPTTECTKPQTGAKYHLSLKQQPKAYSRYTSGLALDKGLNVLLWSSQIPDLTLTGHLQTEPKMEFHRCSSSSLTKLERICQKEMKEIPKSRCSKLNPSVQSLETLMRLHEFTLIADKWQKLKLNLFLN